MSYTYDAQGNQKSIQSGTNHKIEYLYDDMNRLAEVAWDGGTTRYQYDKNGNQTAIIHSNGMKSSYTFDGRNLLTGIVNQNPDGTKQEYSYTYDAEGLLKEKVEPKGKTTYTYTAIQQLDTMTEPNGRVTTYTYDKAGNRQSQTVKLNDDVITEIVYTYNDLNHLTQTSEKRDGITLTTTYTYDANGNQTEVSEKNEATGETAVDKYKYDELNQLIRITGHDGSKSEYTYYGTGLRASKNVNNSTAVFIYDGKEILAETTTEGTKTNIFGNNMIATTGTDTLYYQYNNHGDVVRVLDQSGTLKNEYDYDAFGNAITEKETVKNPYRYAGYYQDTESGLYYLRSRYYNPKTARFLTEDTASGKYTDPLSLNKYTYCHNQPVTGYDPDGHALQILLGAAIGGVIGAASSLYEQRKVIGTGAYSYKKYWGSVAEGAITGAVAAATGGTSLMATASTSGLKAAGKLAVKKFAVNTTSGIVGNTANQLIRDDGKSYDIKEAFTSGLTENIDIPGLQAAEKTAKKVGSKILNKVTEFISKKAGHEVAEEAGSKAITKTIDSSKVAGVGESISTDNIIDNNKSPKKQLPDWLKQKFESGNQFNRENRPRYPYNEVKVVGKKKKYVVDSYVPGEEIVSRKFTQLSDVKEKTGMGYLNELVRKYSPGTLIDDGPFVPNALKGTTLQGNMILEVPVQNKPIPDSVLNAATTKKITIRDVKGKEYN